MSVGAYHISTTEPRGHSSSLISSGSPVRGCSFVSPVTESRNHPSRRASSFGAAAVGSLNKCEPGTTFRFPLPPPSGLLSSGPPCNNNHTCTESKSLRFRRVYRRRTVFSNPVT